MMTPKQFNAAGLNKLSQEELQKLDAWLQGYRQVTEKKATARAAKVERTKMDLLVSRVDGTFNGLTGRTVIRLEDGTVWKQANADDRYRPKVTDHPAAAVIHGIFGYKMQRSEEHTSELQSQFHLVCRLLLEKKKKGTNNK